jgi:hypothetical protein
MPRPTRTRGDDLKGATWRQCVQVDCAQDGRGGWQKLTVSFIRLHGLPKMKDVMSGYFLEGVDPPFLKEKGRTPRSRSTMRQSTSSVGRAEAYTGGL